MQKEVKHDFCLHHRQFDLSVPEYGNGYQRYSERMADDYSWRLFVSPLTYGVFVVWCLNHHRGVSQRFQMVKKRPHNIPQKAMKTFIQWLRRALCWHKYNLLYKTYAGDIYYCPRCGAVFQTCKQMLGTIELKYLGQYDELLDDDGMVYIQRLSTSYNKSKETEKQKDNEIRDITNPRRE